ncbi:hypothetical protein EHS25_009353 [Saitozyma podzolica]|uniref:Uncharacterized protein n=1 Tax=Saitozyma podzolica TaxID=1890683 RepID=A0A427YLJ3_9TREE|nr:hypothetical protein EHS25_009353 [Saitozyma podzolica]
MAAVEHAHPHPHFSPKIVTPETDPGHVDHVDTHAHAHAPEIFTFPKQPVAHPQPHPTFLAQGIKLRSGLSSPPTSAGGTDSEAGLSDDAVSDPQGQSKSGKEHQPISLLSALLHSPEHQLQMASAKRAHPPPSTSGLTSARSSAPSTTFSSPAAPHHGILQNMASVHAKDNKEVKDGAGAGAPAPTSILRRGSTSASSDGGEAVGLGLAMTGMHSAHGAHGAGHVAEAKLSPVEEKRERIGWADEAPRSESEAPLSRAPSTRTPALKFAVAAPPPTQPAAHVQEGSEPHSRRPSSPFARERKLQRELDLDAEMDPNGDGDGEGDEDDECAEASEESPDARLPGYRGSSNDDGRDSHARDEDQELDQDRAGSDDESFDESDLGYQEDEEDGEFSDDPETAAFPRDALQSDGNGNFAFARPTNWRRRGARRQRDGSPSASPPPAPAVLPPPARRGRGHIRVVDDPSHSGKEGKKGCSRHCSPPPARSRSNSIRGPPPPGSSPSARNLKEKHQQLHPQPHAKKSCSGRLSDAGPRDGRAGSPMPPRVLDLESELDEEDDDEDEATEPTLPAIATAASSRSLSASPARPRGGWRSDDSIFHGPNSQQTRGIGSTRLESIPRNISAPPPARPVFSDSDDERERLSTPTIPASVPMEPQLSTMGGGPGVGVGDGMRNFLRRASEHLPMFRRPSVPLDQTPPGSFVMIDPRDAGISISGSPLSAPLPSQSTCPPALDDTPALARSQSPAAEPTDTPLTHRLERALSVSNAQRPSPPSLLLQPPRTSQSARTSVVMNPEVSLPMRSAGENEVGAVSASGSGSGAGTSTTDDAKGNAGGATVGAGLTRATTLGGRVTFQPTEKPARDQFPPRSVSHALSADEGAQKRAKIAERAAATAAATATHATQPTSMPGAAVVKSKPILCPRPTRDHEGKDLGWTDEALLHIRKNAGKE